MDRTPSRLMYAVALVVMAGALGALHLVDDVATAIAYAVVFGLANASMHVNVGYLWADYFGRRHLGSIQGTGQTCLIVGASLAARCRSASRSTSPETTPPPWRAPRFSACFSPSPPPSSSATRRNPHQVPDSRPAPPDAGRATVPGGEPRATETRRLVGAGEAAGAGRAPGQAETAGVR